MWNESAGLQLTCAAVEEAAERIASRIRETPLRESGDLNRLTGAGVLFKCENFQVSGSFKARGAFNAVFSLGEDEASRGVVTHSSGNHAAALSYAAAARGIPSHVVMPRNAPQAKARNVEKAGGRIVWCEPNMYSREETAERVRLETGAALVHPFNDYRVMAGQGTVGLELARAAPDVQAVLVPVGGGGLMSGVAVAIKAKLPGCRLIGVEPEGADDATRSFQTGQLQTIEAPDTIADGLRAASLGSRTFPILSALVDEMVTVSDEAIVKAMKLASEIFQMPVEPSGAVTLAALLPGSRRLRLPAGKVAIVVSGGNLDAEPVL